MKSGVLVYKCRRCGELSKHIMVPDVDMALVCIMNKITAPKKWNGNLPGILNMHTCGDGNTGITDLIGGEKDKGEKIQW